MPDIEIEFVDELPKIERRVESGAWVKRLEGLDQRPNTWAKVYESKNPHALVNNLNQGNAAGVDPEQYEFKGRTHRDPETGETTGYVFARYLEGDERERVNAERNERSAKAEQAQSKRRKSA